MAEKLIFDERELFELHLPDGQVKLVPPQTWWGKACNSGGKPDSKFLEIEVETEKPMSGQGGGT